MGKKKLNYVDEGINTTILAVITVIVGLITVIALATNYIIGVFSTIIFMILAKKLIDTVIDFNEVIEKYVKGRKW